MERDSPEILGFRKCLKLMEQGRDLGPTKQNAAVSSWDEETDTHQLQSDGSSIGNTMRFFHLLTVSILLCGADAQGT